MDYFLIVRVAVLETGHDRFVIGSHGVENDQGIYFHFLFLAFTSRISLASTFCCVMNS
jgi:hypothetical protein